MRIRGIIKIFPMLHVYSILSVQKQFAKISSNTILMPLPGSITEIKNSWSMRVTSLEASLHMRPFSGPTPHCFSVHLPLRYNSSSTTLTTLSSTDKSCHIYVDQCQHCHKNIDEGRPCGFENVPQSAPPCLSPRHPLQQPECEHIMDQCENVILWIPKQVLDVINVGKKQQFNAGGFSRPFL